jgi:hypothetical protein
MAMDYKSMADRIQEYIGDFKGSSEQQSKAREFIEALTHGIVDEIVANAEAIIPPDSNGDTTTNGKVQ